uniref:Uncharacterized protein n=1 Tax=Tetranychus urticae TaxID=32264 RepID=T1K8X0_TETUR
MESPKTVILELNVNTSNSSRLKRMPSQELRYVLVDEANQCDTSLSGDHNSTTEDEGTDNPNKCSNRAQKWSRGIILTVKLTPT